MWRGEVGPDPTSFPRGRVAAMTVLGCEGVPTLNIGPALEDGEQPIVMAPYYMAERVVFDMCPVCLTPGAGSKEHVGPEVIGGKCLTRTCGRCNNELGRRLDKALVDWCTSSQDRLVIESPNVFEGHRYLKATSVRMTDRGEPVWVVGGDPGADVRRALASGEVSVLRVLADDLYRVQFAALKNAYLAVALLTGTIPMGDEAVEVRRLLVEVRDLPAGASLPESTLVRSMLMSRSKRAPDGPAVALTAMTFADGTRAVGLSFSGVLSTSWPLASVDIPEQPPAEVWARRPV